MLAGPAQLAADAGSLAVLSCPGGFPRLPGGSRGRAHSTASARSNSADGPVRMLAGLSLVLERCRGRGALHDAVSHGQIVIGRVRRALSGLPLPAWPDGRIKLAVDVSNWLRSDAVTSRGGCSAMFTGRAGQVQLIPGWPYSAVALERPHLLGRGRNSPLALRLYRLGDHAHVVAALLDQHDPPGGRGGWFSSGRALGTTSLRPGRTRSAAGRDRLRPVRLRHIRSGFVSPVSPSTVTAHARQHRLGCPPWCRSRPPRLLRLQWIAHTPVTQAICGLW